MSRVNKFQEGHGVLKESWTPPSRKRRKVPCDHVFRDSVTCVKCGWDPGTKKKG